MRTIKGIIGNTFMNLCRIFPLKDKIIFSSFDGKMYGDNPGAIFEKFVERYGDRFEYIWLMNDSSVVIEHAVVVKAYSIRALYHAATAKLWIHNSRQREWIVKRKGQYYVQTWHGDVCLKKIEKDAADGLGQDYVKAAIHDSEIADLMISGSRWRTDNFRHAFWYYGEILEKGTPKSDIFYEDMNIYRKKVNEFYNLDSDVKIALYVPTFRKDKDLSCCDPDYEKLLEVLTERWNGNWVILVRLHPEVAKLQDTLLYSETILNGTLYGNTNELIVSSDFILTDYSGCMFAGLEAGKKVFLYASDMEKYVKERDTYFSFEELPFPLSQTRDELYHLIQGFDEAEYEKKISEFQKKIGLINGSNSAEKVVRYLYDQVWGMRIG